MPRSLQPIPPPLSPLQRCTYRRKCPNTATHWYCIPSLTRGRNHSVRLKYVCAECAVVIRQAYPQTIDLPPKE